MLNLEAGMRTQGSWTGANLKLTAKAIFTPASEAPATTTKTSALKKY